MKLSQVFRLAQKRLWTGDNGPQSGARRRYICLVIGELNFSGEVPRVDRVDTVSASRVISCLLEGHSSLESWLLAQGHISPREFQLLFRPWWSEEEEVRLLFIKLQATRLAWLDHLIEHYESLGE